MPLQSCTSLQLHLRLPFTLQAPSSGLQVRSRAPSGHDVAAHTPALLPSPSCTHHVHPRLTSPAVVGIPGMAAERGGVSLGLVAGSSRMHTAAPAQATLGNQSWDLQLGHVPASGPAPRHHPGMAPLAWEETVTTPVSTYTDSTQGFPSVFFLTSSCLFDNSHSNRYEIYLIAVLIRVSLMISDIGQLFLVSVGHFCVLFGKNVYPVHLPMF